MEGYLEVIKELIFRGYVDIASKECFEREEMKRARFYGKQHYRDLPTNQYLEVRADVAQRKIDAISHIENAKSAYKCLEWLAYLSPNIAMDIFSKTNMIIPAPDFEDCLAYIWQFGAGQGRGIRITKKKWVELFHRADKERVMGKDSFKMYNEMPEEIVLYRGFTGNNEKAIKGMSWTTSKTVAENFASRGIGGYVYQTTLKKKYILAYFGEDRNEFEAVVDYSKLRVTLPIERVFYEKGNRCIELIERVEE